MIFTHLFLLIFLLSLSSSVYLYANFFYHPLFQLDLKNSQVSYEHQAFAFYYFSSLNIQILYNKQQIFYAMLLYKKQYSKSTIQNNNLYKKNMQVPISNGNVKVDKCFFNSLTVVRNNMKVHVGLHLLQFLTMVIMIPLDINIFKNNNRTEDVLSFFVTATCITFVNLASKSSHLFCKLQDTVFCMAIAFQMNHTVQQQPQSDRLGEAPVQNTELLVSNNVYNAQTDPIDGEPYPQQVLAPIRRSIQPALTNMIKSIALSKDPLARCTMNIGGGISFALFIYGIVILATVPSMQVAEIIVISLFLASQFIIQIQIFACLIFIAFLPILCFGFCIFVCCCKQGNKQAKLPQAVQATVQIIQNSDGSPCSICFQNLMLNEKVVVLPCSQKHVFHQNCITTWTQVKSTCPICRHDLSQ